MRNFVRATDENASFKEILVESLTSRPEPHISLSRKVVVRWTLFSLEECLIQVI